MILLQLPQPVCVTYFDVECEEVATRFYTEPQMQAYGQQCRETALEEAATLLVDAAARIAACPRSAENEAAASTLTYQAYKIRDAK